MIRIDFGEDCEVRAALRHVCYKTELYELSPVFAILLKARVSISPSGYYEFMISLGSNWLSWCFGIIWISFLHCLYLTLLKILHCKITKLTSEQTTVMRSVRLIKPDIFHLDSKAYNYYGTL